MSINSVATLIDKGDYYICSHCRMKQNEIDDHCWWCEASFSNYQEILIKIFKMEEEKK